MPGSDAGTTKPKKPADQVTELRDLVVGYAKQETIDPLRALKRYLVLGISGALCIGFGAMFLMLGLLRGLQEINWFNGPDQADGIHGSWILYIITALAGFALMGLAAFGALRSTMKRK